MGPDLVVVVAIALLMGVNRRWNGTPYRRSTFCTPNHINGVRARVWSAQFHFVSETSTPYVRADGALISCVG